MVCVDEGEGVHQKNGELEGQGEKEGKTQVET